jgi:DNA polymerase-3 subunit delta
MPKAASGLYLLLGPEEGEKDAYVRRLLERIARERGGPPEVHRYYPFEMDLSEVLALLANGSLFAAFRLAVLHNAEELKSKRDVDLLAGYAAHPSPDTALLLLSAEVGRMDKRIERLASKDQKIIFWELFESQKQSWVNSFFRTRGMNIEPEAVDFLLDMVENNTRELQAICERLALFFGKGARVGYADVERLLYHSKEENGFTLFERLAARDLESCLEVLSKILLSRDSDAVQLLALLAAQVRKLFAYARLLASNYDPNEAAERLEIRGKRVQQTYAGASRRYSLEELRRLIRLTALFDCRARSFKSALHPALLELYLYYAVVRGGLPPDAAAR